MKLTQEQLNELSSKLKIPKTCPICGYDKGISLQPNEYQLTSTEHSNGSYKTSNNMSFMPLAAVVCPNCGYVRLFNLNALGIAYD